MNLIGNIRSKQRRWAPRVLASWCVVWLGLAMQPCAMAFSVSEHDQDQQHHGMHGEIQEKTNRCPHCPSMTDARATDCIDDAARCAYPEDIDYDGRVQQLKKADVGEWLLPASFVPLPVAESVRCDRVSDSAVLLRPGNPPVYLQLCVFLK